MASQGHPSINTLHMIKHDPTCLKVIIKLYMLHQIQSTSIYVCGHLEKGFFSLDR
jgi:hypothetical protein